MYVKIGTFMTLGLLLTSQSFASKSFDFEDGTKIETQAGGYKVSYKGEKFDFKSAGTAFENPETKEIVEEFIGATTTNREDLSFAEVIFPKDSFSPTHQHFKADEFYYVVQGAKKALTFVGDKQVPMKTGSFIHIPKNTVHHITNNSNKEVRLLVACEPAWKFADYNLVAE